MVVDSETGLIHEPGNAEQLVEHVLQLQEDNQRAQEMGRRGRRWLEANAGDANWQSGFSAVMSHALNATSDL